MLGNLFNCCGELVSNSTDGYGFHTGVFTDKNISGNFYKTNSGFKLEFFSYENMNQVYIINFSNWEFLCKKLQDYINGNFCADYGFSKVVA